MRGKLKPKDKPKKRSKGSSNSKNSKPRRKRENLPDDTLETSKWVEEDEEGEAFSIREFIENLSPETKKILRDISGAILLFLSLFTLWAFLGREAGALGKWINEISTWALGSGKFILSSYLLLLGLYLISPVIPSGKFIFGSIAILLGALILVTPEGPESGFIAGGIKHLSEVILGKTPTLWLSWILIIVGSAVLTERELRELLERLIEFLKTTWSLIKAKLRSLKEEKSKEKAQTLEALNEELESSEAPSEDLRGDLSETSHSERDLEEANSPAPQGEAEGSEENDKELDQELGFKSQEPDTPEIDLKKLEPLKPKTTKPEVKTKRKPSLDINEILSYIDFPEDEYILPPKNFLKGIATKVYGNLSAKISVKKGDYSKLLEQTLRDFGVEAKVIKVQRGPTVTRYELQPARGVKVSQITRLKDDLALSLAAIAIRIEAPIPGKSAIGIEVPNRQVEPVYLAELLASDEFQESDANLPLAIGKDISGNIIIGDLSKMPHLLIAGATGSGKTVCINSIIVSLIYKLTPEQVQLILIDPKMVELVLYEDIPHLVELSTDVQRAPKVLRGAVLLMEERYKLFSKNKVRNITEYNSVADSPLPYIVIVIDELADLMMTSANSVETSIARLAQLARAAGIHLIVATQRPSVNVITGIIKANIPSRIAFAVASQVDSRVIIDQAGAENLIGRGDMLYWPIGAPRPIRVQGAYVGLKEIEAITEFWRRQKKPSNLAQLTIVEEPSGGAGEIESDEDKALIKEAIRVILMEKKASTTLLQRRLKIGFARAGRLMDTLEQMGVVGPQEGSKPRKILVDESFLETLEGREVQS